MELKALVAKTLSLFLIILRNPFNGIERRLKAFMLSTEGASVNPFNGIESRGLIRGQSPPPPSLESIQWN